MHRGGIMSGNTKVEKKERGLLEDAWAWARTAESGYDVRVACELRPSGSKGVWEVYWNARAEHQNGGFVVVCSYTTSYPTAHHSTLAGAILRGSVELDRLIDQWALGMIARAESAPA